MNRMIQMHICTERGLRESSWGRSWWEECVLENGEWISKMSDFVIDEDVQIVCWAKWRELSHTHVIGVWTKWVGMIVRDNVEMKGREKEWYLEWMGWWWVWSTAELRGLVILCNIMNILEGNGAILKHDPNQSPQKRREWVPILNSWILNWMAVFSMGLWSRVWRNRQMGETESV